MPAISFLWRIFFGTALVAVLGLSLPPLAERHAYRSLANLSATQGLDLESAQMQFSWGGEFTVQELIFSQEFGDSKRRLLEVDEARLEFDWGSFFSGEPQLSKLRVKDARLNLLADDVPVSVEKLSGTLHFEQDWIHLLEVSAVYHGLQIGAEGKLHRAQGEQSDQGQEQQLGRLQRYMEKQGRILARAESLLKHLGLSPESSTLQLSIQPADGQAQGEADELSIEGKLSCANFVALWPQQSQQFESLEAQFQWDGVKLELTQFTLQEGQQSLQAVARFDSRSSHWQVDLDTDINWSLAAEFLQSLSESAPEALPWPEFDEHLGGGLRWQLQASWQDQPFEKSWLSQVRAMGFAEGRHLRWREQLEQSAARENESVLLQSEELSFQFAWSGAQLQVSQLSLKEGGFHWSGAGTWAESQIALHLRGEAPQSELFSWAGERLGVKSLGQLSTQLSPSFLVEPMATVEATLQGHGSKTQDWQLEAEFFLPQSPTEHLALDFLTPQSLTISGKLSEVLVD